VTDLKSDDKPPVWNSDGRVYHVLEEAGGNLFETIYFDPFKHPSPKHKGNLFRATRFSRLISRGNLSSLYSTPSSEDKAQSAITKPIVCIGYYISSPDWESSHVFMAFDACVFKYRLRPAFGRGWVRRLCSGVPFLVLVSLVL
jgi:Zn-dependent oligopeptidase